MMVQNNLSMNYDVMRILKAGTTTNAEYYYDHLVAPPLSAVFYEEDIRELHRLATSVKLSGNGYKKINMIHKIMKNRGFYKLAGGTNRVVYYHPDVPGVVYKVAIDAVGIKDNPAEFSNQFLLKPYCTKVFEVSPCGTVGSFERVERITSFEEFCTIADDVFYLITRVLIGKYVLDDIGIDFFMNYGISNRGPVILDFPYVYELDGGKLLCNKTLSNGKRCRGEIDYDDGFNCLVCEKCGAVYKARDLGKSEDRDEARILVQRKGAIDMEISAMRGNEVVRKKTIDDGVKYLTKTKNLKNKVVAEDYTGYNRSIPIVSYMRGNKMVESKGDTLDIYSTEKKNRILEAEPYRETVDKDKIIDIDEIKKDKTPVSVPTEEKTEEVVTEVSDVVEEPEMVPSEEETKIESPVEESEEYDSNDEEEASLVYTDPEEEEEYTEEEEIAEEETEQPVEEVVEETTEEEAEEDMREEEQIVEEVKEEEEESTQVEEETTETKLPPIDSDGDIDLELNIPGKKSLDEVLDNY